MATATATILSSSLPIKPIANIKQSKSSSPKRIIKVKYLTGLNSFGGLKAQNNAVSSLGLPVSTEQSYAKIVSSLHRPGRGGGGGGGALSSTCNAIVKDEKNSVSPKFFSASVLHKFNLRVFLPKLSSKGRNSLCKASRLRILALTGAKKNSRNSKDEITDPSIPSWAKPGSDEPPPWWARDEAQKDTSKFEVPFFVYLLASAITAIAAIGSAFEYVNQNPVFGVLNPDSVFYAPLLGFFAFTGIPTSAFLWFKSVQVANKEAEEQDRRDGYL